MGEKVHPWQTTVRRM